MALSVSFLFSAINVQTASKDELMCIKGIGDKKADAIIKYRKTNKLKSAEDLINIKGLGKVLVQNVKSGVKSVACGGKKSVKKTATKKSSTKSSTKETVVKKSETKKSLTKNSNKTSSKENLDKKPSAKKLESEKSSIKSSKKDSTKESSDKKSETKK